MGNLVFDARSVAPSVAGQGQLPPSDENGHHVRVTNTLVKPTKENTGGYLEVAFTVLNGEHANASGVKRFHLFNQSQKAVEIAYQELSALCYCIGRIGINNHEDLRGGECRVIVQPQANDPKYTEVKGFKDVNGTTPDVIAKAVANGQQPAAPAQPANGFQAQPAAPAPAQNAGFAPQPQQGGFQAPPPAEQQQPAQPQWSAPAQPVQGVAMPGQAQPVQGANGMPAWATGQK